MEKPDRSAMDIMKELKQKLDDHQEDLKKLEGELRQAKSDEEHAQRDFDKAEEKLNAAKKAATEVESKIADKRRDVTGVQHEFQTASRQR
jgi:chromosome segregation ATPase